MRTGLLALAALIALVGTAFASRAPQLDLADLSYAVTAAGHLNKTAVCVARDGDAAHGWRMAGLGSYQGFDWSPTGSRFAVAFSRRSTAPILTAEADPSAGFRALTSPRLATEDDSAPKWSPDGRAVAFARYIFFGPHVDYRRFGLWLVDVRTRRERHLSRRFPTAIAWSPDGQHLAVRFIEDLSLFTGSGRLEWTISRSEGSSGEVAWSPSGDLLAARFGREVLLLSPQRTTVARITRPDTELGPLEVGLGWSPDGRQLALGGGEVYDRSGEPTGRRLRAGRLSLSHRRGRPTAPLSSSSGRARRGSCGDTAAIFRPSLRICTRPACRAASRRHSPRRRALTKRTSTSDRPG